MTQKMQEKLSQELAELSEDIGIFESLKVKIEDAETLIDLAEEESDESIFTEASLLLKKILKLNLMTLNSDRCLLGSMMREMLSVICNQEKEEQKHKIGLRCFFECINGGRSEEVYRLRSLLFLRGQRPESHLLNL